MMSPRWRRQPGKKLGSSITKSRFLDVLTLGNRLNWTFLKIDQHCGDFERKMGRVCVTLIKLSFDKDFKEWTF